MAQREIQMVGMTVGDYQQFDQVDIDFHPRLTIITGANGCGKSTILRFLARQFGWTYNSLATPTKPKLGPVKYIIRWLRRDEDQSPPQREIGRIKYRGAPDAVIRVPREQQSAAYHPLLENLQTLRGVFLPSHRQEFGYSEIGQIPTKPRRGEEAFSSVNESLRSISMGHGGRNPSYTIKETLIGLAYFGPGNQNADPHPEAQRIYEEYQRILRIILPPDLGFQRFVVRNSEVVLVTDSNEEFLLDAVSGGIGAQMILSWQLMMYADSIQGDSFTVLIDEPENHLHPGLQRTILPSFLEAFPQARFIIATHSPLVVGSVKDSYVYALKFTERRRVRAQKLDLWERSGSAGQVLQQVLDVPFTRPVWVEDQIREITDRFARGPFDAAALAQLRGVLKDAGLEVWAPEVIAAVAERTGNA